MTHGIADTAVHVPSAWMPPGQVGVTAAFFGLFGEGPLAYHLIFLFNALLGTAAVYVLGKCTGMITGNRTSQLVALYAAALFPPFVSAAPTWGIASSVLLLNSLAVYRALLLSRAITDGQHALRDSVYFGLMAGVLALFRAEAPLTIAFMLLGLLIFHRRQMPRDLKYLVVSGTLMLAVLSPWLLYNYSRFDSLILGSTSGGFNLWRGNNPNATGGGWAADGSTVLPDRDLQAAIWKKTQNIKPAAFERAYSAELAASATSWIKNNPWDAALLSLKKVLLIWIVDLYHPNEFKYVHAIFQLMGLGFAIYGIAQLRKLGTLTETRRWLWIAGGACAAATLLTMVFFSLPRYQIFLVGLYFPLVAIGLHAFLKDRGLLKDAAEPVRVG
jgi:hypothetical protein